MRFITVFILSLHFVREIGIYGLLYKLSDSSEGSLLGLRPILATESPLKVMKNVFFISLENLFWFLKYLNFCPELVGHRKRLG